MRIDSPRNFWVLILLSGNPEDLEPLKLIFNTYKKYKKAD